MSDDEVVLGHLQQMAAEAEDGDWKHCIEGEPMLFHEHDKALMPGHIYSEAGIEEAKISGCCEYHFDKWFNEEDGTFFTEGVM